MGEIEVQGGCVFYLLFVCISIIAVVFLPVVIFWILIM